SFVNNGSTWINVPNVFVPEVPTEHVPDLGAAFVDLDGDGILDLVQRGRSKGGQEQSLAWLNKFTRPVIAGFPNGLAAKSQVAYSSITSASAHASGLYSDNDPLAANTKYLVAPVGVVSTVTSEDGTGTGTTSVTSYGYESLRAGTDGRGPLGF